MLVFGGLLFILVALVKINKEKNSVSIEANKGKEKYLLFFGFIVLIIGCLLSVFVYASLSPTSATTSATMSEPTPESTPETIPTSTSTPSSDYAPSVEFKKIWFGDDFRESLDSPSGMDIHVTFDTQNLKGNECTIMATFYDSTGKPLKDYNENYTLDSIVATYDYFTPSYVDEKYTEFTLYIPYDEFHIPYPGNYDLQFTVQIFDNNNKLLARSDPYQFTFTK